VIGGEDVNGGCMFRDGVWTCRRFSAFRMNAPCSSSGEETRSSEMLVTAYTRSYSITTNTTAVSKLLSSCRVSADSRHDLQIWNIVERTVGNFRENWN
jgi:hypothetical protein